MAQWSSQYDYTESQVRRVAPISGGVYRLWSKGSCFYVGQSDNLERRLLEHLQPGEPDACIRRHLRSACLFDFCREDSAHRRDEIERSGIERLAPECNG